MGVVGLFGHARVMARSGGCTAILKGGIRGMGALEQA